MPLAHSPTRREMLLAAGVLFTWANLPRAALAEGRDPRFLAVILRGGLDGLAAVPPVGDPAWVKLRGDLALTLDAQLPALPLDNYFALHPAMPNLHRMYKAGQAVIAHAVASPYRERSHFDGQDILESGFPKAGHLDSGWLNRALETLAPAGRVTMGNRQAFAVGPIAPLVIRGSAKVLSWTPPSRSPIDSDTLMRLLDLYRHTDLHLAQALEEHLGLAAIAGADVAGAMGGNAMGGNTMNGRAPGTGAMQAAADSARNIAGVRAFFANAAGAAAKYLAHPNGPRIGAISFNGWDTHANEGPLNGRLSVLLGALDDAIAAFETGMGSAWNETVVVVLTEFGRTARINGTMGTDHGTATTAFLAGGALKGGRMIADWPGVSDAELYEGRDLRPTTDLRAILKGLLRDHLRVPDTALATSVFPDSGAVQPVPGLIA